MEQLQLSEGVRRKLVVMRRSIAAPFFALGALTSTPSAGQTPSTHGPVPVVQAVRATAAIVVDGQLNDEVWLRAPAATTFTQREPDEGKPATEQTELRIAYDDAALYVGARLKDREPRRIARQLARRDQDAEADSIVIMLDPHHDHRDRRLVLGHRRRRAMRRDHLQRQFLDDSSWDAVWESAVTIDESGWSVEMRIPYSQLRFPSADQLTFGINAMRYIQRKKEQAWLVHVPKTESGLASRMGHLEGLKASPHAARWSSCHTLSAAASSLESSPADPFNDGARAFTGRASISNTG